MRHADDSAPTTGSTESDDPDGTIDRIDVVVIDGDDRHTLRVDRGRILRDALLDEGVSPYAPATRRLNCGGRGLCATCGVRIREGPSPDHWHDRVAERFGYPRLSCQILVEEPMTVELVDKHVWGRRKHDGGNEDACDDDDEQQPDL